MKVADFCLVQCSGDELVGYFQPVQPTPNIMKVTDFCLVQCLGDELVGYFQSVQPTPNIMKVAAPEPYMGETSVGNYETQ